MLKNKLFVAIIIATIFSSTLVIAKQNIISSIVTESVLKIEIVNSDRQVLQVSIDGKNEGNIGITTILNSKGEVVYFEESEIVLFPAFYTIDISKFKSGIYNIKVETETKHSFKTSFEVK